MYRSRSSGIALPSSISARPPYNGFRPVSVLNCEDHWEAMTITLSGSDPAAVPAPSAPRLAWRRTGRQAEVSGRTIRRDVDRLRGLGYPVKSLLWPGRRLPASSRRHRHAPGPGGRRGDRDRRRTADRRRRLRDRDRGDVGAGAGEARAGAPGAPSAPRQRLGRDGDASGRGSASTPLLDVIAAACRDLSASASYRSREGVDSRREVEPHSLVNLDGAGTSLA